MCAYLQIQEMIDIEITNTFRAFYMNQQIPYQIIDHLHVYFDH